MGPEVLALLMFAAAIAGLLAGYNVASTLGGVGIGFAAIGIVTGTFEASFLGALPGRIFPLITRDILIAVPLFVFMGVMLEKSRIAEDLLAAMGDLFGALRGGLGISVIAVGALLAASTGIVGATVVTMGLLSLPTMLKRGYDPGLASGAIAASGTLGQIIPPSIVLVILADQISNAYQEAQRTLGVKAGGVVSVGDLFESAIVPGLLLVALYALYIVVRAFLKPSVAPAEPWPEDARLGPFLKRTLIAMLPPILLIVAVLGSILSGYATPTRGAALGGLGAILLATWRTAPQLWERRAAWLAAAALAGLVALDLTGIDIRLLQTKIEGVEIVAVAVALGLAALAILGVGKSLLPLLRSGQLADVSRSTLHITAMVFFILIGATVFSLVFRGFGGDEMVADWLLSDQVGDDEWWRWRVFAIVMLIMFLLGFFLDFIEITFVVVPLVAPPLIAMGFDPVWLGIVMALNLQTSFLTPPFGFALFYLRGVAPPELKTPQLYRGVIPFILIQLFVIGLVIAFPGLV
jgi:tripartite ATP-independent transporter DctM subunit